MTAVADQVIADALNINGTGSSLADCPPKPTYALARKNLDFSKALDGNLGTVTLLPQTPETQGQWVNIDFHKLFTAQAVSISLDAWNNGMLSVDGTVQVSDDGENYHSIRQICIYWPNSSANSDRVSSRHYRILIKPSSTGWLWHEYTNGIPLGEIQLHEGPRIDDVPGKALYLRQGGDSTQADVLGGEPEFPQEAVIPNKQILDISKLMQSDGSRHREVPAGRRTVLRVGHTSTGVMKEPAPKESMGLECDKLSKRAIGVYFEVMFGKLLYNQSAMCTGALKKKRVDSRATGSQTWTVRFRKNFPTRARIQSVTLSPQCSPAVYRQLRTVRATLMRYETSSREPATEVRASRYCGNCCKG